MDQKDIRLIVRMDGDYTTESHNLGKRTYKANGCYQVCETMFQELMATGKALQLDPREFSGQPSLITRESVCVIPKVTRWFTANGFDTHHLKAGEPKSLPSNLATFLTLNGLAVAA